MKEEEEDQTFLNLEKNLDEIAIFIKSRQGVVVESKENQVEELLPRYEACHKAYRDAENPNKEDCHIVNVSGRDDSLDCVSDKSYVEDIMQHDSGVDIEKFKTIMEDKNIYLVSPSEIIRDGCGMGLSKLDYSVSAWAFGELLPEQLGDVSDFNPKTVPDAAMDAATFNSHGVLGAVNTPSRYLLTASSKTSPSHYASAQDAKGGAVSSKSHGVPDGIFSREGFPKFSNPLGLLPRSMLAPTTH
ncbi:hypothetical protein Sjap_023801 [Stephania japonica]|uniref:Uncharacterized protein n=1 Tax=Stephania japonica TaxID=461633 RepID=A0AAP0EKW3_9MAGN